MREWEALGRLAITLPGILYDDLSKINLGPHAGGYFYDAASMWKSYLIDLQNGYTALQHKLSNELNEAGLLALEWVIWITPVLPDKSFPPRPEEYQVALRLRGTKSAAKSNALGNDPQHKPTLSEQHEKK
jgi:hypothetical protein